MHSSGDTIPPDNSKQVGEWVGSHGLSPITIIQRGPSHNLISGLWTGRMSKAKSSSSSCPPTGIYSETSLDWAHVNLAY